MIPAPFCVVLSEKNGVVVQPDLSVICNRELLRDGVCMGAPDLVVEIVSPNHERYDYYEKLHIYDKYGIREYWLIDPQKERIIMYALEDGLAPVAAPFSEVMASRVIQGLALNLGQLLAEHEAQF